MVVEKKTNVIPKLTSTTRTRTSLRGAKEMPNRNGDLSVFSIYWMAPRIACSVDSGL